jgi:hypothetical protein
MPQVRLVGVCDADPVVAGAIAQQYDCAAYATPADLLTAHPDWSRRRWPSRPCTTCRRPSR